MPDVNVCIHLPGGQGESSQPVAFVPPCHTPPPIDEFWSLSSRLKSFRWYQTAHKSDKNEFKVFCTIACLKYFVQGFPDLNLFDHRSSPGFFSQGCGWGCPSGVPGQRPRNRLWCKAPKFLRYALRARDMPSLQGSPLPLQRRRLWNPRKGPFFGLILI